jgi:hypothetical protein
MAKFGNAGFLRSSDMMRPAGFGLSLKWNSQWCTAPHDQRGQIHFFSSVAAGLFSAPIRKLTPQVSAVVIAMGCGPIAGRVTLSRPT